MKIAVIERIKKLPKQTEESLHDALSILLSVEDRKSVDHYVKWIRAEVRKLRFQFCAFYFPKRPTSSKNESANSHPLKNAFFTKRAFASHRASTYPSTASSCSFKNKAFALSRSSATRFASLRSSSVSITAHSAKKYSFHNPSSVSFIFLAFLVSL